MQAYSIQQQNKALTEQQNAMASAANLNYQLEQQKEVSRIEAAGLELTQEQRQRNAERATMRAAAGESGVAGASPLRNTANSYVQQALSTGSIISKEEADLYSSSMENVSNYARTLSGINQAQSQKTTGFNALMQIGLSAGGGYMAAGGTFGGGGGTFTNAATGATTTFSSSEAAAYSMADMTSSGYTFTANTGIGSKQLGYYLVGNTFKK